MWQPLLRGREVVPTLVVLTRVGCMGDGCRPPITCRHARREPSYWLKSSETDKTIWQIATKIYPWGVWLATSNFQARLLCRDRQTVASSHH